MSTPCHKTGLGSKILSRARIIFGLLLSMVIILTIAGIYQGIQSGEFYKVFVKPFKQFAADLKKAVEQQTPTLSLSPTPKATTSSTSTSTTKVIINQTVSQTQPRQSAFANCIRKNIREGEFASNKCYSQQDYEDLQYYLDRYSSAKSSLAGAEASIRIACKGSDFSKDFFKDSCERDKQTKSQAEADISKYRGVIQGIIAKGQ